MSKPEPLTAEQKIAITRASINAVRSGIKNPAVYDRATHVAVPRDLLRRSYGLARDCVCPAMANELKELLK